MPLESHALRGFTTAPITLGMRAHHADKLVAAVTALPPTVAPVVLLAGFGGGLRSEQRPGDVVVATKILAGTTILDAAGVADLPGSADLAGALQRAGMRVTAGPVWSSERIVRGTARRELAKTGAAAVDMESAPLAKALAGVPDRWWTLVVVRVLVDTPQRGLLAGSATGGVAAYRTLRRVGLALRDWRPELALPPQWRARVSDSVELRDRTDVDSIEEGS